MSDLYTLDARAYILDVVWVVPNEVSQLNHVGNRPSFSSFSLHFLPKLHSLSFLFGFCKN